MTSFSTPTPITAIVTIESGALRITAGDVTETVVDVRPTSAAREEDVRAAERTQVEFADGELRVKGPKQRSPFAKNASVDVEIRLPAGSRLDASAAMANLSATGPLGACAYKTSCGDIQVADASSARLSTGYGEVAVDRVEGAAEITTGSGDVRVGEIGGAATIANSNGSTKLGEVRGELRVKSSNGAIAVGLAGADVDARTANGSIRLAEVVRGTVTMESAAGELEVGVREGTAAWLDVRSRAGALRQSLGSTAGPDSTDETVQVRGRTGLGDIVIRRAA
ncbi:DUF4097 family beta strand repeat-containing protein [Streptomyces sp. NPDC050658]|uniref:DUF4097 family beta strand repeat-containing protein n=1 Tax=unclassified Streptomyces TaxID=2593676 RepID=UPI0034302517